MKKLIMKKATVKVRMRASLFLFFVVFFSGCESPYMVKHPVSAGDVYYLNATYYGDDFNGKKAADGSVFNANEMTSAAKGFPFGTYLLVQSMATGNRVVVKVTDRPGKNVLDLSKKAFSVIDDQKKGKIRVKVKVVSELKNTDLNKAEAAEVVEVDKKIESKAVFYAIEFGTFDDLEKAKEFQKTLEVDAYIFAQNNTVFKVRYGRFVSREEVEKTLKEKFSGKKANIVEVDE